MGLSQQPDNAEDMALDLGGLLKTLGKAMRWLLPLVIVVAGGLFLALQIVPSKYTAEGRLLIESKDAELPGSTRGAEEERALLDTEGVESQVQLLMSRDLARRVAKRLDLAAIPEFDAEGRGSLLGDALAMIGIASRERDSAEDRVLEHYYENLEVFRLDGSRVIAVQYTARDAELSALVANTILSEYIALQSSVKRVSTEEAASALEPQIRELRQEVQSARKAVADFRARADLLFGSENITLSQQQLTEISTEVSAAEAASAEAKAKADQIRELLNTGGSLESASDVLESPLIQRLRERQVEIQSNIAEQSITLLPSHPTLRALQSQLNDYNNQIRSEARKVAAGLESEAQVAQQRAEALNRRLEQLKQAAARTNADQVRLAELEREADAKADQLDTLLARFREADSRLRAQVLPADARIISEASIPLKPSSPKILLLTVVAALATFLIGAAWVIMGAFLSGRALYPVSYGGPAEPRGQEPAMNQMAPGPQPGAYGSYAPGFAGAGVRMTGSFSGFAGDFQPRTEADRHERTRQYVADMAEDSADPGSKQPPERPSAPIQSQDNRPRPAQRKAVDPSGYDRNFAPEWVAASASPAASKDRVSEPAQPVARDAGVVYKAVAGCTVVLSVDDAEQSHMLAFSLARRASEDGYSAVLVEAFPEMENPKGAPGFSDLALSKAVFSESVYRDARSRIHIIESGRFAIPDDIAESRRFQKVLDALATTYEVVVFDLGRIDGSLAGAKLMAAADQVFVAAGDADQDEDLQGAADLLARNSGARVEVVPAGFTDDGSNGPGKAA
ncbi:uncharacterized protein involved in exopolysaccharide biosynthesis [Roseibium hamelinense]|uniref:Uncharacterized protein involved in exopolysaccharide biosynthesis n=1 Tax=Roseibium hamelinense TaxID=150831 RepID=A0A562THB4_9HYPH|nr:exopolysaccharide transport family protein [Roseibium hamelinense]MTI46174.1 succinoglycan transporter [Roseibium hamelinense]TWI92634.1 uncharacterized protein involved in exopolysaccharide biosynthesis [Roseibium hamelinense]